MTGFGDEPFYRDVRQHRFDRVRDPQSDYMEDDLKGPVYGTSNLPPLSDEYVNLDDGENR